MKLIIISDTHGRYDRITALAQMHRDADALIFLGDGLNDLARADVYSYGFGVFSLRGNCDGRMFFSNSADSPEELSFCFEGYRFFALHGHTRDVKSGMDRAIWAARERNADVLLFGHTHIPTEHYLPPSDTEEKGLYIFNPGSLGSSRDGLSHFGIVEIRNKSILFSHGTLKK